MFKISNALRRNPTENAQEWRVTWGETDIHETEFLIRGDGERWVEADKQSDRQRWRQKDQNNDRQQYLEAWNVKSGLNICTWMTKYSQKWHTHTHTSCFFSAFCFYNHHFMGFTSGEMKMLNVNFFFFFYSSLTYGPYSLISHSWTHLWTISCSSIILGMQLNHFSVTHTSTRTILWLCVRNLIVCGDNLVSGSVAKCAVFSGCMCGTG